MTTASKPASMNEATSQDPYNNSSYGTLVDSGYKLVNLPILDVVDFNDRVIRGYETGIAEKQLPADLGTARSMIPAGTATLRDFSYIAPEIPEYIPGNCTGCMDCVTECPDTAILGKVMSEAQLEAKIASLDPADREMYRAQWAKTRKYFDGPQKKGIDGGMFHIIIDPSKCKGCAECVTVCDDLALKMIPKTDDVMTSIRKSHRYFKQIGPSDERYINDNVLVDMMLKEQTHIYVGGAGSCAGCGEGTALRMMCAATGAKYGDRWGIIAATGCNTVYTSTYPYNPYLVPWSNSLFENAPAFALGVRMRWDQMGWKDRPLWCLGGDGAMFDIGFQSLSRMMASGENVKVFVLDTQVYSNTGGQASTSTYTGQNTKMSVHGKAVDGKQERRKEIAQIAMMHPRTFVAQTTCAHTNHFYRAVLDALEFDGPAVVVCYTTCQPEHGVGDNMAGEQARLAVNTRAFPLLVYDPRKGDTIRERLSLQGNPAVNDDWYKNPKTGEIVDFIDFARSEGRFAKHFDRDGKPSETLLRARQDRLENWKVLQELAGVLDKKKPAAGAAPGGEKASAEARPTVTPVAKVVAKKPVAEKAAAEEAPVVPVAAGGEAQLFNVGDRIRYKRGDDWIAGVLKSMDPLVVAFDDHAIFRTTLDVFTAAVSKGTVQRI